MQTAEEYEKDLIRLNELKDIDDWDERCDEYNGVLDKVIAYENEHNLFIPR